ncbi:MAG: serine protease [Beijerinckiaceae bacterium]
MRENRHFIRGTDVTRHEPTLIGGAPCVQSYHSLIDRLESSAGRDAAALFAEPVLPSGMPGARTTISWYCANDGAVVELETIDEIARKPIIEKLSARLAALEPVLRDPEIGSALGTWLNIFGPTSILSVGGEPVLVDWGFLPAGVGADVAARESHFARTLGRFAPTLTLPPVEAARPDTVSDEARRRIEEETNRVMPTPISETASGSLPPQPPGLEAQPGPPPPPPGATPAARPWLAPLVASVAAAVVLLILLLPGVLKFPSGDSAQREKQALQRLHLVNETLEAQLNALKDVGRDRVCRIGDPVIQVPDLEHGGPPANMEVLPRPPDKVQLPANGKDADKSTMEGLLEAATVLVFSVNSANSATQGTGFFINDHNIVTNRHVVEESNGEKIFVASRAFGTALGTIRHARLVTRSNKSADAKDFDVDFAVLELAPNPNQVFLPIGPTPAKLSTVYIAGFPNFVIQADVTFQNFLKKLQESLNESDIDAALQRQGQVTVPSPDLRYGRVNNVIDAGAQSLPIILHDMQIAPGHSGGPLVDSCGRVGGVNTWDLKNKSGPQFASVAQDASTLDKFLKDKGIAFKSDGAACVSSPALAQSPPQPPAPQ